jgi:integrase/recombinase XerD
MKLSHAIERYLAQKHLDGVRFANGEGVLKRLLGKLGDRPLQQVTTSQVTSYLQAAKTLPVSWWAKYRLLKIFFSYWMMRGEMNALPMPRPRPAHRPPFKPLVFSKSELHQVFGTIQSHSQKGRWTIEPITLRTVLLFLYGTGTHINEVLSLAEADVDLTKKLITLCRDPARSTRTIPIGSSLRASLSLYLAHSRDRRRQGAGLFVDREGRSLTRARLNFAFDRVRRFAARVEPGIRLASLKDFRHTFAVHCLNRWLNEGKDLRQMLPILAVYMGHVKWTWTEQYLSATPERFWNQLSHLGLEHSR